MPFGSAVAWWMPSPAVDGRGDVDGRRCGAVRRAPAWARRSAGACSARPPRRAARRRRRRPARRPSPRGPRAAAAARSAGARRGRAPRRAAGAGLLVARRTRLRRAQASDRADQRRPSHLIQYGRTPGIEVCGGGLNRLAQVLPTRSVDGRSTPMSAATADVPRAGPRPASSIGGACGRAAESCPPHAVDARPRASRDARLVRQPSSGGSTVSGVARRRPSRARRRASNSPPTSASASAHASRRRRRHDREQRSERRTSAADRRAAGSLEASA